MNAKLLLRMLFIILVALLLVLMGMNNQRKVDFTLPLFNQVIQQPAALMYLAFFAVGLLTGTILTAGGGRKGSGGKSAKGDK